MEQELRTLLGKYGFRALHEGLMKEMRQTYEYLSTVFPIARNNIVVPMISDTIPEPITTPTLSPLEAIVVMKDLTLPGQASITNDDNSILQSIMSEEQEHIIPTDGNEANVKEIQITAKGADTVIKRRFDKEEQKAAVAKKREELQAQGIIPESLLTKENLTAWIGEGMSYQRIAREKVGVPDNEISTIAKSFGLQSQMARYMFSTKKK